MRWNPHISRVGQRWNGVRKNAESPAANHTVERFLTDCSFGARRRAWDTERTEVTWLVSANRRPRGLAS